MRERVRGAIPLTTSAVSDPPFHEAGYEDGPQLVDLARPPHAGVECAIGVFDRLLKSR